MRKWIPFFLMILFFSACKEKDKTRIDVSGITVDLSIERFEVDFYTTTEEKLPEIKKKYPMLFPENVHDSTWVLKINDPDERELYEETLKAYPLTDKLEMQLTSLFKHIKYYHKDFTIPQVITTISNIDYEYRIIYNEQLLIISLDCYLGKKHPFYNDFPNYIKENNTEDHIIADVAKHIIDQQVPFSNDRSFLGKIIYEGKKLYVLDRYIPDSSDKEKIGYSDTKYNWAIDNEEQVWKYFLDKNLLYSTDTRLNRQFIDNTPFSKFYLAQDNLSPGRIGVFIGWQIVRSFMANNNVPLEELLTTKSEDIFSRSKYKPRK